MRLLLINPRFPESFWSFKWALDAVVPGKHAVNPPLGLATLAALCPETWEVSIVDENVESIPLAPQVDLVGVCGMGVQVARQRELLRFYRAQGRFTVAGGSYASLCPEEYQGHADTVVAGEAEYIWKEFCRDFEAGAAKPFYQETGTVSLADSPVPRFDLLQVHKYQAMSLQFSRGCPFRCEFCDIIVMFGRKPRTKSVEQIGRELDRLRALGARNVFFVDDNLIGNKRGAKELLRFLAAYQRAHQYRFHFGTEVSLNLAQDPELLELCRAAGMGWVFIGIESPDEATLKAAGKLQNTHQDILASVRTVYAHGIEVFGGFIIGFDDDTADTFERQRRFIMDSGIQAAMVGLLTAAPKTPLYGRLARDGRLIPGANSCDNTKLGTNVLPKHLSYEALLSGYRRLLQRLFDDRSIAARIRTKLRFLRDPVARGRYSPARSAAALGRLVRRGLIPGGIGRIARFTRSLPLSRPRLIPLAVQDWIIGLAMRDYVDRHFGFAAERVRRPARDALRTLEEALRRYRDAGALELSLGEVRSAVATLSLRLRGRLDRRFFGRAARQLERILRETRSSVTLRIDALHRDHVRHLHRLLRRLARHGDRIRISVHESLRDSVKIDSSVFDLLLEA